MKGIHWAWDATSHTARPQRSDVGFNETVVSKNVEGKESPSSAPGKRRPRADLGQKSRGADGGGGRGERLEAVEAEISETENAAEAASEEADNEVADVKGGEGAGEAGEVGGDAAVEVWRRYAFSSQLQRMSVVVEVSGRGLTADEGEPEVPRAEF